MCLRIFAVTMLISLVGNSAAQNCGSPLPYCPADVYGQAGLPDDTVNVTDLLFVLGAWGQTGTPGGPRPQGDCAPPPNGDCTVSVPDLLAIINQWGPCPCNARACCFLDGSCQTLCLNDCAAAGGHLHSSGGVCGSVVCLPNDTCAGAIELFGNTTNSISNADATTPTMPPPGGACISGGPSMVKKDIWFRYAPTCTCQLTVDLCSTTGAVTDTTLQIFAGTCDKLMQVACDDGSCPGGSSLSRAVVPFAGPGLEYIIRVGTWGSSPSGPMTLKLTCSFLNICSENECCTTPYQIQIGDSIAGVITDHCPDGHPPVPTCNGIPFGHGAWYRVFGNGAVLTATTCASPAQAWNARLSVYCGSTCSSLICVTADDDNTCTGLHETVSWCSDAGRNYWIVVHTDDLFPHGDFVLTLTGSGPCNDPAICANFDICDLAIDITGNLEGEPVAGTNEFASPSFGNDPELPPGSPSCQWNGTPSAVHHTVWYKFTAPSTGGAVIETCPSTLPFRDSILALYSGVCGSLTQVACNDDSCNGGEPWYSRIATLNLNPGQQYHIMVGSTGAWTGSVPGPFLLKLSTYMPCAFTCPPGATMEGEPCLIDDSTDTTNGGCNSTPTVYSSNLVNNGDIVCGTASTYLVNMGPNRRDADWYRFVPAVTGNYSLTVNAEFTALIGFVQGVGAPGSPCSGPAFVFGSTATSAGSCAEVTSPSVSLTAGVTYAAYCSPSTFSGFPCAEGRNSYWLRLNGP